VGGFRGSFKGDGGITKRGEDAEGSQGGGAQPGM